MTHETRTPPALLARTLVALLLFSWVWQSAGILLGALAPGNALAFALTLGPVMLSPLVAGLWFQRARGRRIRDLPWRPRGLAFLLLGLAIPSVMALVLVALWQALGFGSSALLDFRATGMVLPQGPWLSGPRHDGSGLAIADIAATMALFGALGSVATIGEEMGWRGVFQGPLLEHCGTAGGVALLGFLWAIWHLPLNLAGYNYPQFPLFGALVLFPLTLIAHSMILAWLTIAARSVWPAVLFNAGIDSLYSGISASLWRQGHALLLHAVEIALFGALALFAWYRLRRPARPAPFVASVVRMPAHDHAAARIATFGTAAERGQEA